MGPQLLVRLTAGLVLDAGGWQRYKNIKNGGRHHIEQNKNKSDAMIGCGVVDVET